jgi:hypothetical protein
MSISKIVNNCSNCYWFIKGGVVCQTCDVGFKNWKMIKKE